MAIYYLSGVDDVAEVGALFKKGTLKNVVKSVKKIAGKTVVKVALAPVRGMFLLLVSVNFLRLGDKLERAVLKDKSRVVSFWEGKFKGKFSELEKAVKKGSKRTPPQKGATVSGENAEIGVVLETAIVAATPILVALIPLLKSILGADGNISKQDEQIISQAETVFNQQAQAEQEQGFFEEYKTPLILGGSGLALWYFFK